MPDEMPIQTVECKRCLSIIELRPKNGTLEPRVLKAKPRTRWWRAPDLSQPVQKH